MDNTQHSNFLQSKDIIEEGDTVIIYINHTCLQPLIVTRGMTCHMKYGALRHEFLIGKRYGTPISATAGYIYALRPNCDLWTRSLPHHTQILYTPDIATIILLLDARAGSIICETGTGSGSLTHALAVAIAPNGHVYSHDIEENRLKMVESQLKDHGLEKQITLTKMNTCKQGFCVENKCDGVFLDLPEPWKAIAHSKKALNKSQIGRLVSFSPCIEQVVQVCSELTANGFVQVKTVEIIPKKLKVVEAKSEPLKSFVGADKNKVGDDESKKPQEKRTELDCIPFPSSQITHTGYLTSATLLPDYSS